MKFGMMFANVGPAVDPDYAAAMAKIAEESGLESLWTVEHVVVPVGYESKYPYSPTGKMPGTEDNPIPDPLIWLTYVAASTSTIRLGTGILILPQRNPVVLAKELATLDVLSKGRLELGIGIGWLKEEFDCIGVNFADRAAITDEYAEAMRVLWRDDEPTFKGRFTSFEKAKMQPKPVQAGGVPIVVGGHTPAAARRAGRLGDGFFPAQAQGHEEVETLIEIMRKSAVDAGRDPDAIEVTSGSGMDLDSVRKMEDLGVSRMVIPILGFDLETLKKSLGFFSENVIQKA